ncbi:MAG TPA: phosphotransferase [Nocardioidaceae bacterium]|nr:phosphotransferase [Nocardioidaceae bacterium]
MSGATDSTSARWTTSAWRDEASSWIDQILRERGINRTGDIEQPRIRFWSTQLTVPTDSGRVWFKENCPDQSFEARLVDLLADLVPDHVVAPLAIEPDRGWMLSPDAGPTLQEAAGHGVDLWVRLAANWADLQRRVAPYADRLLATDIPASPPSEAPSLIAERTEEYAALPVDDPRHLDADAAAGLRSALPTITRWAEQVVALGLPMTLDHNDLHANNAFLPRDGEEHLRFFDFGDSVVGDPLCSLLIPVNVLAGQLDADEDDPRIHRVIDAYLEVWSDLADPTALRAAVDPARQLARLNRSESWRRVLRSADSDEWAEWGGSATAWLTTFVSRPTLST